MSAESPPEANHYTSRWYSTFHDTIPRDQTGREVEFLQRQLPLASFPRVLDLCCGSGRHALPLARAGHEVLGLDLNEEALERARREPSSARFECRDVRDLSGHEERFDAALCLWQSFGYHDEATNRSVLAGVARCLRPGGRFVLDVYHRGFFETLPREEEAGERDGRRFRTLRFWRGPRLTVRIEHEGGGVDLFDWHLYTPAELESLAAEAGFSTLAACAGFDEGRAADCSQPRVQLVFERRGRGMA